jgi:SAM-dependent methyltransferase
VTSEEWEAEAENWIAWARAPGHDEYWYYRERFFELVPSAGRRTLDVGCGEGRVARDLAARAHSVVGLDSSPTLVAAAAEAHPGGEYVVGSAEELPFADASFDLVVAYNSLMDVNDMPRAVAEAGRVLEPGGTLCVCVTHPLMDAGRWESPEDDARFVIEGSYFGRRRFEGTVARAGLQMTFRGWCYPLDEYARAFEDSGFLIQALREPAERGEDPRQERIPLFLFVRALKP